MLLFLHIVVPWSLHAAKSSALNHSATERFLSIGCMDVFVLFVCNSRVNLYHCRTKRAMVKSQNLQHAMFHFGCTKMAKPNFALHPTGGHASECILLVCT